MSTTEMVRVGKREATVSQSGIPSGESRKSRDGHQWLANEKLRSTATVSPE
jgi:hypothetical protein